MREDIPEWLGKPPRRGTDKWDEWLERWRRYAKEALRDEAADDPDYDFGLLTPEERWRVALRQEILRRIAEGRAGSPAPLDVRRRISDIAHAAVVAWQVGRSTVRPPDDEKRREAEAWASDRNNPRRRRIAHAVRYGFLAGLGGEPCSPLWNAPDYVAGYEAAWEAGIDLAIEADPRG